MVSYTQRFSFAEHSLDDTLIDLGVRFVINCPPEDISTAVRLFFQLEEAHWFYEDFAREQNLALPSLKMKNFVSQLYRAMPVMDLVCADPDAALAEFQSYKSSIPVRGGILMNEALDKVLMVRSWKGASWGFPKGKINKEEDDAVCAVREVLEETGYDMASLVDRREYIESTYGGKNIRLYVVSGVPEETHFETQTRKEISRIEWIPVNKLPVFNRKPKGAFNFYMVTPFMSRLKSYIARKKGYATKLSESESGALKNMLGISEESSAGLRNDEETAQLLLTMLRGSSGPSAPAAAPIATAAVEQDDNLATENKHKQDRDILLNLLKQGTPEPESPEESSQKSQAEVEGTKEILALLQDEMATSKTVSTPPTIEKHDASSRPIQAPALPPMGLLESLVLSRKSNPVRRPNGPNPNEHRSTAPSKNSLLNLLNKPKQAESAKLMALLKPVKPPPPTSKRSPLMSLLESAENSDTKEQTETSELDVLPQDESQSESQSKTQSLSEENKTADALLKTTEALKTKKTSSLLTLLGASAPIAGSLPSSAFNEAAIPATPATPVTSTTGDDAPTSAAGTASPIRASSQRADPQPISTMSSAPGRAADAESMQQESELAVPELGKQSERTSRAPSEALLGLLKVQQKPTAAVVTDVTNRKTHESSKKSGRKADDGHGVTSGFELSEQGSAEVGTPQISDRSETLDEISTHDKAAYLSTALASDARLEQPQNQVNSTRPGSQNSNDISRLDHYAKSSNPLLKLLEPAESMSPVSPSQSSKSSEARSKKESQTLMSLLNHGTAPFNVASQVPESSSRETEKEVRAADVVTKSGEQAASAEAPVTREENAETRSSTAPKGSNIHLLKLLSKT